MALARKLNYVPNAYASSLRKQKSKTIALVLPEVADSFFSVAINGIESVAQKKGYHVLIYLTHENFAKEKAILNELKSGRVDGVLVSVARETKHPNHISALQTNGVPVVLFDRVLADTITAEVCTNDFECGYIATKHLIERGCRKIAYLSISKNLSIVNERLEGYKKAIREYELPPDKDLLITCNNSEGHNHAAIKKSLSSKNRPDGILASVEKLIITTYHVCKALHLEIPANVKVAGFSILPSAAILSPPVTTISQPAFEIGEAAADLLFKILEKKDHEPENTKIILPSALIIRGST